MKGALIWLVIAAGCGRSSNSAPEPAPDPAPANTAATVAASIGRKVAAKDFYFAAAAFDDAKPEDAKQIATLVSPKILAVWDAVREAELANARTLGIDRARGKSRKNCMKCERFRGLLDQLAPHAPDLAAKWQALKPELARAEQSAYEAEANDDRPKVLVRFADDDSVMMLECVLAQLRAAYPTYRFVEGHAGSGSDPEAPAIVVASRRKTTEYASSKTRDNARMLTGMEITLTGSHLDKTLAKRFATTVTITHEVHAPDEIRPMAGPAKAELGKVGMRKIDELEQRLCEELEHQLAK